VGILAIRYRKHDESLGGFTKLSLTSVLGGLRGATAAFLAVAGWQWQVGPQQEQGWVVQSQLEPQEKGTLFSVFM
jgi:hypothetical protein